MDPVNDITFDQIARMMQQPGGGDVSMNATTWNEFRERYWPGHAQIPPGPMRVWIAMKDKKGRETLPDGVCRPGRPSTGYRVR
jgi:hypothetical protein